MSEMENEMIEMKIWRKMGRISEKAVLAVICCLSGIAVIPQTASAGGITITDFYEAEDAEKVEENEDSLAERLAGRYFCPAENGWAGDSPEPEEADIKEYYVLDIRDIFGNLYAEMGIEMLTEETGEDIPFDPYSFWAMEIIPGEAESLQRTDLEEVEAGVLIFTVMSGSGKYWRSPQECLLRLTEDGLDFISMEEGEPLPGTADSRLHFQRTASSGQEAFPTEWQEALSGMQEPYLRGETAQKNQGAVSEQKPEVQNMLAGLWKEAGSDTPYFLEFEGGSPENPGHFLLYRKCPGMKAELGEGLFLASAEGDGGTEGQPAASGMVSVIYTMLGCGGMPWNWSQSFVLTEDGRLVLQGQSGGVEAAVDGSPFFREEDTVFERVEEREVPLTALAEADDVAAIRGELLAETGSGTRKVIPQFVAAEDVENNGGHFVRIGNLVFFREYGEGMHGLTALWGDFLTDPQLCRGSKICWLDLRTGETGTAFEDGGYGPLYYLDGQFYSPVFSEEGFGDGYSTQMIWRCWPDGSGREIASTGAYSRIEDVSRSSRYLCIRQYDTSQCYLLDGSAYYLQLYEQKEDESLLYAGFAGDSLILVSHRDNGEEIVIRELCPDTGEEILLGVFSETEEQTYGWPEVKQLLRENGDIYLGLAWYQGTGHFLSDYAAFMMTDRQEESIRTILSGLPGGQEGSIPVMNILKNGEVSFAINHAAGDIYLSEEESGSLLMNGDPYGVTVLVPDFVETAYYEAEEGETVRFLQTAEYVDGAAYVITAEAVRSPEDDIGWRWAYALKRLIWQRIPVENTEPREEGGYPVETLRDFPLFLN